MESNLESNISFHAWSLNENVKNQTEQQQPTDLSNTAAQMPNINFHSIKFSDKSVYIWIGDSHTKLENLSCSMKTPYEREPLGIDILLANTEEQNDKSDLSKSLSIRLAQKLKKQVLISFNVAASLLDQFSMQLEPVDSILRNPLNDFNNNCNASLLEIIERRLYKEIKANPDKFI
jgi:hypothetical protein